MYKKRIQCGFTLIEIMITLVIIGLLTTLAYPSYMRSLLKSHRSDALISLTQNQMILERCYAQNLSYNHECAFLPDFPQKSLQGYYIIALGDLKSTSYTLTATATSNQTEDSDCIHFSVNQANAQNATNSKGTTQPKCWHAT